MIKHPDSAKASCLKGAVWRERQRCERHNFLSAHERTIPRLPNQDIRNSANTDTTL